MKELDKVLEDLDKAQHVLSSTYGRLDITILTVNEKEAQSVKDILAEVARTISKLQRIESNTRGLKRRLTYER